MLSDGEWQRFSEKIGRLFGTDNPPVGRISALQENDAEFYVISVRARAVDRLTIATMSWPKQSVDAWWQTVRNDFPISVQEASTQTYELPQIGDSIAADDTWSPTVAPLSERESHTAVWTGSEMIVWGAFFNPVKLY